MRNMSVTYKKGMRARTRASSPLHVAAQDDIRSSAAFVAGNLHREVVDLFDGLLTSGAFVASGIEYDGIEYILVVDDQGIIALGIAASATEDVRLEMKTASRMGFEHLLGLLTVFSGFYVGTS